MDIVRYHGLQPVVSNCHVFSEYVISAAAAKVMQDVVWVSTKTLAFLLRLEWEKSPFKRSVVDSHVSVHQKPLPVRIPSQFNDGSLYGQRKDPAGAGGKRKSRAKGRLLGNAGRQVLRMVLALVLVVVVINAAAQPELYEPFFHASAVDSGVGDSAFAPESGSASESNHVNTTTANSNRTAVEPPEEIRLKSVEFAADLSDDQQVVTATALMQFQAGVRDPSLLAQMDQIPFNRSDAEIEALIEALIAETEKRVVDGAVWRSSDRDALRLRLLRSDQGFGINHSDRAAIVGVLNLLQQPEAFLGQPVRVMGQIARIDPIRESSAKKDPLPDYWQLWLRPSSGADRPMVALVNTIPDELARFSKANSSGDVTKTNSPYVAVQGTFFKRLAYQSSIGADLAPVVVGRILQPSFNADAAKHERATASQTREVNLIGPIAMVAGAIGLGILLAGLVIWRTAVSAKLTRQIRRDNEAAVLNVTVGFENVSTNPSQDLTVSRKTQPKT